MAMVPDATSNVARLRLTGTPHQHWHEDDLVILLSEVSHVVRTGPLMDNDSYESIHVLIACHELVDIPKTLLMTSCPKAAIVQIELEGWLPIPMEPFDPEEADTIRTQYYENRRLDEHHQPPPQDAHIQRPWSPEPSRFLGRRVHGEVPQQIWLVKTKKNRHHATCRQQRPSTPGTRCRKESSK